MPKKALVVDDDRASCELVQAVLDAAGIKADFVLDSKEAVARLRQERFDTLFLDIRMPAPDGIELARQVRAGGVNQKTPIIMITGNRDVEALHRAFLAGANFFLFKPLDRRRMLRLVLASQATLEREKRRFQRVPVHCRVTLESKQGRIEGTTVDLSLGGLQVEASQVWAVGAPVEIKLELRAGAPPLHMIGRIVRRPGENRMGIKFKHPGAKENEHLQEFLLPLILSIPPRTD